MNKEKTPNNLIHESSPYLLQHAYNPVDWHPWNEKALEKAEKENKLMIISIGYAACHWCHVMERESFENAMVARVMNEKFVPVKVDREERPDIDHVYMNAAYLLTGSGGWPLNVITLPDGRPVFAGTYFTREQWIRVLEHFHEQYINYPGRLEEHADKITRGINDIDMVSLTGERATYDERSTRDITEEIISNIDFERGGTGGAPKFPMPSIYQYLLYYHSVNNDPESMKAVEITLQKMAQGGIYDQAGGGFARYSTDHEWFLPHFEKMLYDNAQLVSLYSKAYQLTKKPLYRKIVYETIEFVRREMTSEDHGFYSSLDADSEGEEGKFYVWSYDELKELIGQDFGLFKAHYGISEEGNWEHGKNILFISQDIEELSVKHNISSDEMRDKVNSWKKILLERRNERVRPGLDHKIIASWNALMLNGLVDAYRAFDDEAILKLALSSAVFIEEKFVDKDFRMWRNHTNGKTGINAFLDDYAFTVAAYINLYQATFDKHWLDLAHHLTEYCIEHFSDDQQIFFNYKSNLDPALISKTKEMGDNVIPSSNSEFSKNLLFLGTFLEKGYYTDRAGKMLTNILDKVKKYPAYHANWAALLLISSHKLFEVAILGNDAVKKRAELDSYLIPNVLFLGSRKESKLPLLRDRYVKGQTTIYVCMDKTCKLPVTDADKAYDQILDFRRKDQ